MKDEAHAVHHVNKVNKVYSLNQCAFVVCSSSLFETYCTIKPTSRENDLT